MTLPVRLYHIARGEVVCMYMPDDAIVWQRRVMLLLKGEWPTVLRFFSKSN